MMTSKYIQMKVRKDRSEAQLHTYKVLYGNVQESLAEAKELEIERLGYLEEEEEDFEEVNGMTFDIETYIKEGD